MPDPHSRKDDIGRLLRLALDDAVDPDATIVVTAPAPHSSADARHWQPPTVEELQKLLPQYEISAFIARGGMGAVYKGMQKTLRRPVAIKVLPPEINNGSDLQFAARFKHEAQAMAQLSHPNIVAVFDAGETPDGLLYFVMEFIEGTDVAQLIASEGIVEPRRAIQITTAVCEALAFAHEEGIIDRDIKPSNIMIDKRGRVKVADFGLAKTVNLEHSLQTQSNMAMGTPDFIAPEALMPGMKVDQRADIYAVGVMLYQMLTGHIPRGRFELPSGVVPRVDKGLDAVVDRAMQTDREKRYSTALEMKVEVESVLARSGGFQPPSPPAQAVENRRSLTKSRTPLLLGAAAATILLGVGAWFLMDEPKAAGTDTPAAAMQPRWETFDFSKMDEKTFAVAFSGSAKLKGGLLHSTNYDICGWNGVRARNVALRTTLLVDANMADARLINSVGTTQTGVRLWRSSLEIFVNRSEQEKVYQRFKLVPELTRGGDTVLQTAIIGTRVFAWLDGRFLGDAEVEGMSEEVGRSNINAQSALFRSFEVLNLDGLSEVEARKAAGIDSVAPSPSLPLSKSSAPTWRKVLTKPEDLPEKMRASAQLQWQDGWISPSTANSPGVNIPSFYGKNRGIRLHGRKTADPSYLICSIWVRKENVPGAANDAYRLTLSGTPTNVSLDFWNDTSKKQETFHTLRPDPPLVAGVEYDLELYAIGDQLIARYNGKLLPIATDKRLTEGEAGLQIKHEARDVEVINLDGLSEAEALKAATHH